jgi:hypothetical protein
MTYVTPSENGNPTYNRLFAFVCACERNGCRRLIHGLESEFYPATFVRDLGFDSEEVRRGIAPILFAFSWIPVFFSQIYRLAQVLRLWDFIFGNIDCMEQDLAFLIAAHLVNLRG